MRLKEIPEQSVVRSEARIEIGRSPLLRRVYEVHRQRLKNSETLLPKGFESTKEVERRYRVDLEATDIRSIEDIDAFKNRLLAIPGAYARQIEQMNVSAYTDGNDEDECMYRLRKTQIIAPENADEENLFRLTLKSSTGRAEGEKEETQLKLGLHDPERLGDRKEFLELWDKGILHNIRTRIYVPHALPNNHKCEIHFEIYNLPPSITDLMRIEVEFGSIKDATYAKEHAGSLPSWVGKDVTDDPAWKSKALVKNGGLPEDAARELGELQATSRAKLKAEEEERKQKKK